MSPDPFLSPGFDAGNCHRLVYRGGGIVGGYSSSKIRTMAFGGRPVHGDRGCGRGAADYVQSSRHVAAGVLVERVAGVADKGASAGGGAYPVADAVEGVAELLAFHRQAVGPVPVATDHLPKVVIPVNPVTAIGVRGADALVGAVVDVGAGRHDMGTYALDDGLQAVELIVIFGGRHQRVAVVREGDPGDER